MRRSVCAHHVLGQTAILSRNVSLGFFPSVLGARKSGNRAGLRAITFPQRIGMITNRGRA